MRHAKAADVAKSTHNNSPMIPSKEPWSGWDRWREQGGCAMPFTWLRNYFGIDEIERCDPLDLQLLLLLLPKGKGNFVS